MALSLGWEFFFLATPSGKSPHQIHRTYIHVLYPIFGRGLPHHFELGGEWGIITGFNMHLTFIIYMHIVCSKPLVKGTPQLYTKSHRAVRS